MNLIKNIEELKKLSSDEPLNCFIALNFGFRSSKVVQYYKEDDTFYIINEIDNSEDELSSEQLFDERYTNIGEALNKKALYAY